MKCALCDKKDCYAGKDCIKLEKEIEKQYTGDDLKSMKVSTSIEARH
jgi:uncharacterized metal-binding protein